MLKNRRVELAAFFSLVAFTASPCFAALLPAVQIQTGLAYDTVYSDKFPGNSNGGSNLSYHEQGVSFRARLAWKLLTRNGKDLELLLGPFAHLPLNYSFSNYGNGIRNVSALEVGGDIGASWFGLIRTLFTVSPDWTLSFQTTSFGTGNGNFTQVDNRHSSFGLRVEAPVYYLESLPGDRRCEFGGFFTYQFDQIQGITIKPLNFTPAASDPTTYNREINSTQKRGYRWMLGAYMNFRL